MSNRFYITPTSDSIPFDNDTNGFTSDNVQDAIEESRASAVGDLIEFAFITSGNTSDKWLGYSSSAAPSNEIPFVVPQDAELKGLTFSNRDDDVDIDVQIFKNGSLLYTWEIRNKRVAWNVGLSGSLSFNQTDRISCFLKKYTGGTGDTTAQDPIIEILLKITNEQALVGGIQNGL